MSPKDCSSAPRLHLPQDSPLEVVTRFETEAVPFVAKAHVPSLFGKFTVYGFLEKLTGKKFDQEKFDQACANANRTASAWLRGESCLATV